MSLAGDDHVIDHGNAEQQTGLHKLQRQQAVCFAGTTIAAGMVVHDQCARHALAQQGTEHIRRADQHAIHLAQGGDVTTANAVARIQAKDMHRLLLCLP